MYNLFLDDERIPYSSDKDVKNAFAVTKNPIYYTMHWQIVRNYYQFVNVIQKQGMPSVISFDHDLGKTYEKSEMPDGFITHDNEYEILNTEMSGYDALKWLCNLCLDKNIDLPVIWLHTANTTGFTNMRDYIKSFNKIRKM
jgi:hypothetical protein